MVNYYSQVSLCARKCNTNTLSVELNTFQADHVCAAKDHIIMVAS